MASPKLVDYINRHLRTAGLHAAHMRAGVESQIEGAVNGEPAYGLSEHAGAADVYIHTSCKLKFWDTAGPLALAKAAGLTICDFNGAPIDFEVQAAGYGEELLRHRQTILIGTADAVATARHRLGENNKK